MDGGEWRTKSEREGAKGAKKSYTVSSSPLHRPKLDIGSTPHLDHGPSALSRIQSGINGDTGRGRKCKE